MDSKDTYLSKMISFLSNNRDEVIIRIPSIQIDRLISAMKSLDEMVGMKTTKASIVDQICLFLSNFGKTDGHILHTIIKGPPGTGKCLGRGTMVRIFNPLISDDNNCLSSTSLAVEEIELHHQLVGDDLLPRRIFHLARGVGMLYSIRQEDGLDYVVNGDHILTLFDSTSERLVDISLRQYLTLDCCQKNLLSGVKITTDGRMVRCRIIEVSYLGMGDYFGFEIDGNGRFLLSDGTITHNTTLALTLAEIWDSIGILGNNDGIDTDKTNKVGEDEKNKKQKLDSNPIQVMNDIYSSSRKMKLELIDLMEDTLSISDHIESNIKEMRRSFRLPITGGLDVTIPRVETRGEKRRRTNFDMEERLQPLPPLYRNQPLMEKMVKVVEDCEQSRENLSTGVDLLKKIVEGEDERMSEYKSGKKNKKKRKTSKEEKVRDDGSVEKKNKKGNLDDEQPTPIAITTNTNTFKNKRIKVAGRIDFVGEYLGHTAVKTDKFLKSSIGCIVIVEEAYDLFHGKGDSFGMEAVTVIIRWMTERPNDIQFIFNMYDDPSDTNSSSGNNSSTPTYSEQLQEDEYAGNKLKYANRGLERRFGWEFIIPMYSQLELAYIFRIQVKSKGWKLDKEADDQLNSLFQSQLDGHMKYGGGDTDRLLHQCKLAYGRKKWNMGITTTATVTTTHVSRDGGKDEVDTTNNNVSVSDDSDFRVLTLPMILETCDAFKRLHSKPDPKKTIDRFLLEKGIYL